MKNDILQHNRERAVPAEQPPSPFSAAVRLAGDWLAGLGFLRFHAAAYAIVGATLLLTDLIRNPSDPWAVDFLRVWLILLGSHAVGVVVGWVTWRAVRPHRLAEVRRFLFDADEIDAAAPVTRSAVGPPRPLPATGRFTPGRIPPDQQAGDEPRGLSGALSALGDAVADFGELVLAGVARVRRGMGRIVAWIQGDDEELEAEEDASSGTRAPQPVHEGPTPWSVPTGAGRPSTGAATPPPHGPALAPRVPAPIVPISRPVPPNGGQRSVGVPGPGPHSVEPTPLTPRPARRREVSG